MPKAKSTEKRTRNPRLRAETWAAIRAACDEWGLRDPLTGDMLIPSPDKVIISALGALSEKRLATPRPGIDAPAKTAPLASATLDKPEPGPALPKAAQK